MTIEENKNNVYQAVKEDVVKGLIALVMKSIDIAVTKYVSSDVAEEFVQRELSTLPKIALINS